MQSMATFVGCTQFEALYFLGDEDRFGPFVVEDRKSRKPVLVNLDRKEAVSWLMDTLGWSCTESEHWVRQSIRLYYDQWEINNPLRPGVRGCCEDTAANGQ